MRPRRRRSRQPTADKKPAARIGDRLLDLGPITLDQLEVALFEHKRSGRMLGTVLVDLGFLGHDTLASVLAESSGYEQFDPRTAMVDPEVVARIPKEVALRHRVVPLSSEGRHVFVAMCDPYDVLALDQLRRQLGSGATVVPKVCPPAEIGDLIDRAYGYAMSIDGIIQELETGEGGSTPAAGIDAGYAHPLVRLVDAIPLDAVKVDASDIHFEPEELVETADGGRRPTSPATDFALGLTLDLGTSPDAAAAVAATEDFARRLGEGFAERPVVITRQAVDILPHQAFVGGSERADRPAGREPG